MVHYKRFYKVQLKIQPKLMYVIVWLTSEILYSDFFR